MSPCSAVHMNRVRTETVQEFHPADTSVIGLQSGTCGKCPVTKTADDNTVDNEKDICSVDSEHEKNESIIIYIYTESCQ